jgi:acetyltransferase-like isoleucine patch superfamily enzyme
MRSIIFKIIKYIKEIRKNLYRQNIMKVANSYTLPLTVNGPSFVTKNTFLGQNVNFNGFKIIGKGKVTIGDNFHSGAECIVITDNHNFEGKKIPYDETYIVQDVIIKDNVWIGHGVIILGGTTIGEGAIVQAGSVVVKNIPDFGIAGGHPAKVFKYRDKQHYLDLKKKKKFL